MIRLLVELWMICSCVQANDWSQKVWTDMQNIGGAPPRPLQAKAYLHRVSLVRGARSNMKSFALIIHQSSFGNNEHVKCSIYYQF